MASAVTWAVTLANHCQVEVNIKRKLTVRRGRLFYSHPHLKRYFVPNRTTHLTCVVCVWHKKNEERWSSFPLIACFINITKRSLQSLNFSCWSLFGLLDWMVFTLGLVLWHRTGGVLSRHPLLLSPNSFGNVPHKSAYGPLTELAIANLEVS